MQKINLISLGCAKNLTDSEVMLYQLRNAGYEITPDQQEAEIIIVNTCCFIESAKQESIDTILEIAELKKTGALKLLIVAGCMGERYQNEVLTELPEVDAVCGTGDFADICKVIEKAKQKRGVYVAGSAFAPLDISERVLATPPYTAYLKIAEGCDNHCTYCIIPKIRGKYRSRSMENIVEEAKQLASGGVKELILIAQDTSCYGTDLYQKPMLEELLRRLSAIDGILWIRLHYLYPEQVSDALLDTIASLPKVLHYFDIPIQHISDRILQRMARKTNGAQIRKLIESIREKMPDACIRTSLIVGFPGETEAEFDELLCFIKAYRLGRVGVFVYSQEENTPAASYDGQIDEDVKNHRQALAMQAQYEVADALCEKQAGTIKTVLVEGYDRMLKMQFGRSYADSLDVDPKVFFTVKQKLSPGTFVKVKITDHIDYDLIGVAQEESGL